jgi:isopentenyl-diphosphate delta-isomerase
MSTSDRKADHIQINLTRDVQSGMSNGFEAYHFIHQALPEIDLDQIDTTIKLFGKNLSLPLIISSMTGGTGRAEEINRLLARSAENAGIAMGLGSMRAAIEDPKSEKTFKVRDVAPNILLFANLGAVQLNYSYSIEHCKRLIDMISADGLILHLNPLQEALQPEGNTHFAGLLGKIEKVCKQLDVPVIVKEVGWGIDGEIAKKLVDAGVRAIDVAGAGGTSWSQVEMYRQHDHILAEAASAFKDWGIPTAESIVNVHKAVPDIPIIGSGGLRNGIDLAKSIALGATVGGFAGILFRAAHAGESKLAEEIRRISTELRVTMFAVGASNLMQLSKTRLVKNDWNL